MKNEQEKTMKFIKTIMAAALLTTALSTASMAGGLLDQDNDTLATVAAYGYRQKAAGVEPALIFSEATLTDLSNAGYDAAKGINYGVKMVKRELKAVFDQAILDLTPKFINKAAALKALLAEAKKLDIAGTPLTVALDGYKPNRGFDASDVRKAVDALIGLVAPVSPDDMVKLATAHSHQASGGVRAVTLEALQVEVEELKKALRLSRELPLVDTAKANRDGWVQKSPGVWAKEEYRTAQQMKEAGF